MQPKPPTFEMGNTLDTQVCRGLSGTDKGDFDDHCPVLSCLFGLCVDGGMSDRRDLRSS